MYMSVNTNMPNNSCVGDKLVHFFHHIFPRNQTQVIRPGGKCLYLIRYLPTLKYYYNVFKKISSHIHPLLSCLNNHCVNKNKTITIT